MLFFWKDWLKTLTTLVILMVILETILPENELRKFAKLVLGLVLMTAVLQPILALVYLNWDMGDWVVDWETDGNEAWQEVAVRLQSKGSEPVLRSLDQSVVHQVEALVFGIHNVEHVEVHVKNTDGKLGEIVVIVESPDEAVLKKIKRVVAHYLNVDEEKFTVIRREPWQTYSTD